MRIQHNIMAMSAYRNYTNNVSAMKKNLEKLSSGYKINRAGDDAAGLAISEKMRAQITGLETAQKNAKDGISLVQTAEGALTEVHDMLNRMVELATQSANGTYDNETDRAQMQKEINQLRDEIDRIADSANFNGIKLLDGSMDSGATEATTTWSDPELLDIGNAEEDNAHTGVATAIGHVVRGDGVARSEPTFTIDLSKVKFTATELGDDGKVTPFLSIGDDCDIILQTKDGTAGGTAFAVGDTITGEALATAIANTVNNTAVDEETVLSTTGAENTNAMKGVLINGNVYKAEAKGTSVVFTLQDKDGTADFEQVIGETEVFDQLNTTFNVDSGDGTFTGLDGSGHAATKITWGVDETAVELAHATFDLTDKISDGTKLTIGEQTYVFAIGADSKVEAGDGETLINMKDIKTDDAKLVDKAIAKLTNQTNSWFRIESGATGKVTVVEKLGADGKPAYAGEGDIKTKDGLQSNFKISQMTTTAADEGDPSKSLTLQIGDTAEDFNKLTVNIKDMHCASLGIDDSKMSIANQVDAAKAVDLIKKAINSVSDVRGTLGATQNRLDHTINNLSVMTENIQDAESTIRDVDVAEEMMAYTKNNILIQSAQAMLAQANQVPQGVLQLLG